MNDSRIRNILKNSNRCKIFYLDKNSEWCFNQHPYKHKRLKSFPLYDLEELLSNLECEDIPFNTLENIKQIRKELFFDL